MNEENSKSDFIKLLLSDIEDNSSDENAAKEYLSSQGYNVESVISSGLKKIRQIRFHLDAKKTKSEMINLDSFRQKAIEWVENLLNDKNFSFPIFVKSEQLELHCRNIESLTEEDIKDTLIEHFTLKYLDEDSSNDTKI